MLCTAAAQTPLGPCCGSGAAAAAAVSAAVAPAVGTEQKGRLAAAAIAAIKNYWGLRCMQGAKDSATAAAAGRVTEQASQALPSAAVGAVAAAAVVHLDLPGAWCLSDPAAAAFHLPYYTFPPAAAGAGAAGEGADLLTPCSSTATAAVVPVGFPSCFAVAAGQLGQGSGTALHAPADAAPAAFPSVAAAAAVASGC